MKTCNKCNERKPLDSFFKDKNNKTDGRYSICKKCKTAGTMKWREANTDKYNEDQRAYNKVNYYKLRLQRYKMTPEKHQEFLILQEGKCAICREDPKGVRPLVVDHDHFTGKVRGLLCYKCNRDMAVVDAREHLEKLIAYRDK